MNMVNTYFGFNEQYTEMQKGRIEKTLDKDIRYNNRYMTEKEFTYLKLQEGYTPQIEEDYTYYKRNGELSKPKTLYMIKKDNSWYEINKTLYNYGLYLLENDFLNEEKANNYIAAEVVKAEAERQAELERIEQQKIENERKKEQAEKERQERLKNNFEKGMTFIEDRGLKDTITEITRNHWRELQSYTSKDFEGFMNDVITHFAHKFAHIETVKSNLHYLICEWPEYNTKRIQDIFEENVLKAIFNINDNDSKQTITAKVKAYYENREYKGGTTKQTEIGEFYYFANAEGFKKVTGERWNYKGLEFFIYENERGMHVITEMRSGSSLTSDKSKANAIKEAKGKINTKREIIETAIENAIRRNGMSPNVKEAQTA